MGDADLVREAVAFAKPRVDAFRDPLRDWSQVKRVYQNAIVIHAGIKEPAVRDRIDMFLVKAACVLHLLDHGTLPEGSRLKSLCSELVRRCAIDVHLEESKRPQQQVQLVSLELGLLRDAVKLGQLGGIGNFLAFGEAAQVKRPAVLVTTPTPEEWRQQGEPDVSQDDSLVGRYLSRTIYMVRSRLYHDHSVEIRCHLLTLMEKFMQNLVRESRLGDPGSEL